MICRFLKRNSPRFSKRSVRAPKENVAIVYNHPHHDLTLASPAAGAFVPLLSKIPDAKMREPRQDPRVEERPGRRAGQPLFPRESPGVKNPAPYIARLYDFCLCPIFGEAIIRKNAVILPEQFGILRRELMRQ